MRASILALALGLGLCTATFALAQTPNRTPPPSVTLTGEQWSCLATRMTNLKRVSTEVVRVPLSPCGQGSTTRGPGASNTTVRRGADPTALTDPRLTRAPLYLSRAQLACIERQLPTLSRANGPTQVDLTQCAVN